MNPYQQQLGAYQSAAQTVNKSRQVVMLYDGMIRFLSQAKEAMQHKRIEDRFNLLTKASNIIQGLQNSLDFEQGGDVAETLYDYYASVDGRIMALHTSNSKADCEELICDLKQMRDAWSAIDQGTAADNSHQAVDYQAEAAGVAAPSGVAISV